MAVTAAVVAINTGISQNHARRRMHILEDADCVEVVDERGYYRITRFGEKVILGQADDDELEAKDPDDPEG